MSQKKIDPFEEVLNIIIKGVGRAFKYVFMGIKSLRNSKLLITFAVAVIVSIIAYLSKNKLLNIEILFGRSCPIVVRYFMYWGLLLIPFFCLMVIGRLQHMKAEKYYKIFADIRFIGKDDKYPHLLKKEQDQDGKKTVLTFKSHIPLSDWQKSQNLLETGLDCNIRATREGNNKKIVELVTVPSSFKIPNMILWDDSHIKEEDGVLCIGESDLNSVSFDLNKTPHVLCAGETGSGKSVILRSMLWQMINKGARVYMIDFKGGVEFSKTYEKFGEVVTDRERALKVLQELVRENESRLKLFRNLDVKNLKEYNEKTGSNLCRIVAFIDEIAEMLDKKGVPKKDRGIFEQLEGALSTLARLSRATGINLILGVQRPDANVLPGQIKNNIPVRISGRFADKVASEIVLGNTSACNLPETKGRFLYKVGNETIEFQAFYFDDNQHLKDIEVSVGNMLTEKPKYKEPEEDLPEEKAGDIELDLNFED